MGILNKDQFPEFNQKRILDEEIKKKIEIGNKRLTLVMSVWSTICIIPYYLLRGVSLSNKICNKIWKN
jgi:hypothetical protein